MAECISYGMNVALKQGEKIIHVDGRPYLCWHDLIDIRVPLFNDPSILLSHRVPLPLWGVNPRSILTKIDKHWWERTRTRVYESSSNHCRCCGVSKWHQLGFPKNIDAHELYDIDYTTGNVKLNSIVPLCASACHKSIHYGRLTAMFESGKTSEREFYAILGHANKLLADNNLPEKDWDAQVNDNIYNIPFNAWNLELEIDGKLQKFYSLYKTQEELEAAYAM